MNRSAALLAAAADADLLVVGSRGLHGLRALGSVSERVAHQAHSSVMIVRNSAWQTRRGGVEGGELSGRPHLHQHQQRR